jgi:hypothetical protein
MSNRLPTLHRWIGLFGLLWAGWGCTASYQLAEVRSTDFQLGDHALYVHQSPDVRIQASLWARGGTLWLALENTTDQPLYIHWLGSTLSVDGQTHPLGGDDAPYLGQTTETLRHPKTGNKTTLRDQGLDKSKKLPHIQKIEPGQTLLSLPLRLWKANHYFNAPKTGFDTIVCVPNSKMYERGRDCELFFIRTIIRQPNAKIQVDLELARDIDLHFAWRLPLSLEVHRTRDLNQESVKNCADLLHPQPNQFWLKAAF